MRAASTPFLAGLAFLALASVALAGCAKQPPQAVPMRPVEWAPMTVTVTSPTPGEEDGTMHVAWRGDHFGLATSGRGGLPEHVVVTQDGLFTSHTGETWVRWPSAEFIAAHAEGMRLHSWDLVGLVAASGHAPLAAGRTQIPLDLDGIDGAESSLEIEVEGWHVASARLTTPLDPGSPFTFHAEGAAFVPLQPDPALDPAEVVRGDAQALQGQRTILAWVEQYHEQLGSYPDDVTPQSLTVQSLGQSWPVSPYDGQPMQDQGPMGHFDWRKCSAGGGVFTGHGWDGATLVQTVGTGCP